MNNRARSEAEPFRLINENYHRNEKEIINLSDGLRKARVDGSALYNRNEDKGGAKITPDLDNVSETMLWALHNRAAEARRIDGILVDPDSVRIHEAIDYDFVHHFGSPMGSLAFRAAEIDRALRRWLKNHPDGCVVSLGEGLETQLRRVDNGRMRWLSVDLPDAIHLRECFLPPTDRFRHIAVSALDPVWMDAADPAADVFIVAQGLLMYLEPEAVQRLFSEIADRFPVAEMTFDVVPRWFSRLTLLGLKQTPQYQLPPMPWGINRNELEPTLRRWIPRLAGMAFLDYQAPRGLPLRLGQMLQQLPIVRHEIPSLMHIAIEKTIRRPTAISNAVTLKRMAPAPSLEENELTHKPRKQYMTTINPVLADNDVLAAATQNASGAGDLAVAAGHVIAKRLTLGMAALLNPLRADYAEFARIVPEKVEAFSAAGMIMLEQSNQAKQQMTRFASDEVMATTCATIAIASCPGPVALAAAQGKFALEWFDRAASSFLAMSMLALGAQAAAMTPVRQTVVANAERLCR